MDLRVVGIQSNFSAVDWLIVVVYLIFIVSIGVYIKKYVANVTDFIVAGRKIKVFLAVATMVGTELGLITVMYAAQKGFTGGFAAFHIALAGVAGTLLVGLSGFIVVPLRKMKVMTIPEFYERRFGRDVRILGGVILALAGILNMGMFLKAGSLFVMGITGMTTDLELKIIMSILLGMVLLYTTLGGMISVVILDYIQFVVLSISLFITCGFAIYHLGIPNIVETVANIRGEAGFNPFHGEGFGFFYVAWMFFLESAGCAVWQPMALRACSVENTRTVRKMYLLTSIGFLIRIMVPCFLGVCAFTFIAGNDGLRGIFLPQGEAVDPQLTLMAFPIFLNQILPVGLIGIVTAGMLAALMSTHDSYLLCWSSVLTQDVVAPCYKKELSSKARMLLTRVFIVVIGAFLLIWGLWYPLGQDLWDYVTISGAIYFNGAIVLLTFGIYWKRASRVGAFLALICGFCAILGLKPIQAFFGIDIQTEIVGLTVVTLAVILMVAGSLLFPDPHPQATFKGSD